MTGAPSAFAGLDPCVHCGFCLQACPTFLVTGDEADGPRGRIVLMQALARGAMHPTDDNLTLHLDRCLGCRACEPVCPSGVSYGPALEEARRRIAERRPVPLPQRLVHAVLAEPALRRPLLGMAKLMRPLARLLAGRTRVGFGFGMLAASRGLTRFTVDESTGPRRRQGRQRRQLGRPEPGPFPTAAAPAALFAGCIQSSLFSHVHAATRRTLALNGYSLVAVPEQGCCGALHAHAGQHAGALDLARRNVLAFAAHPDIPIVVNSAGCGALLKEYGRVLAGDPLAAEAARVAARVRDVTELLAERGPRQGAPLALRAAYDPPCHLMHAQRVVDQPEAVLRAIPELELVRHDEADLCCGSAGSYSLVEAEMSRAVLDRKLDALLAVRPNVVATGNPGCVMQIGAGLLSRGSHTPVLHPVELLDRSYREAGWYDD